MEKPTIFMTNRPYIGEELSQQCDGCHRHLVLIGGKAKRAEIYPDELCRAMLNGLMKQMKADGRHGCSYRADEDVEMIANDDDSMEVNQVCWEHLNDNPKCRLEWTRHDYGTSRLMLPGKSGPLWSSCLRRVTVDLDSGKVIEDRSATEIKGRERRRDLKGKPRNT